MEEGWVMLRRSLLIGSAAMAGVNLVAIGGARADALEEVKKRGTLVIGTEAAYVPYEFVKDGKIIGYDPDIIEIWSRTSGSRPTLSTPRGPASSRRSTPTSSTASSRR